MDILGRKRAKLQQQLDQTQKDLKEALDMTRDALAKFTDIVDAAFKVKAIPGAGASILYSQNRPKPRPIVLDEKEEPDGE